MRAADDLAQRQLGRVAADNLVPEPGHKRAPHEYCPGQAPGLGLAASCETAAPFL